MSATTLPDTPYKGLMPYAEEDASFFFGREPEREIITANLMASRLTLFYGASGVGKSSVLRAGVAYSLRQQSHQNLAERGAPEFVVVTFSSWRDDPIVSLLNRVQDSVVQTLNGRSIEPVPPEGSFSEILKVWTERVGGDLLVILDQFEEYFLYHATEDGEGTFAVEFPRAVNRSDLRVSFLVSMREDALAKLDRFKGRIPNLFDNYLRIEHLDREAARAAIEKPIAQFNRLRGPAAPPVSIEPALVDAVLDQVKAGQVVLGDAGRGIISGAGAAEDRIETPYLQLVLTRLWNEEARAGSRVLRLETLNRLGGAGRIVRTHLDAAMSALPAREQDVAARVFRYLVTPSGTKIAHTAPDLASYAETSPQRLAPVLEKLSSPNVRILRPVAPPPDQPQVTRYEIFHDVLAPAILDWRTRYARHAQTRRLGLVVGGLGFIALLVLLCLGVYALYATTQLSQKSHEAQQNAQQAQLLSEIVLTSVPEPSATPPGRTPPAGRTIISSSPVPTQVDVRATAAAVGTSAAQSIQQNPVMPTATPACVAAADWLKSPLDQEPTLRAALGCPTASSQPVDSVTQQFEHGLMLWRKDTRQIYVLLLTGTYAVYSDTWDETQQTGGFYSPPSKLIEPVRGFGKIWREQLSGPNSTVGWATGIEVAVKSQIQTFDHGFAYRDEDGNIKIFVTDGRWKGL